MIKGNNGKIEVKGKESEVLADLSLIIQVLTQGCKISEEMVDIAVNLGKEAAKGKKEEFMENEMKKAIENKIGIDLTELMKQIKEEKED